jgi:hypothetical protein
MAAGNVKYFKGKIANLIGYQLHGEQLLRSMPGKVHQTKATKQSGKLFGKASGIAAAIRHRIPEIIPYPSDLKMQTRLTSSIYKWLKEKAAVVPFTNNHLSFIEGYQFTEEGYTLSERCRLPWQIGNPVEGLVQISIPAFIPDQCVIAPNGTVSVVNRFAAVNCYLDNPEKSTSASTELKFDYNNNLIGAQTISLLLPTPPGSLLVTAVSLKYMIATYQGLQASTAKGFQPAAIVSAMSL